MCCLLLGLCGFSALQLLLAGEFAAEAGEAETVEAEAETAEAVMGGGSATVIKFLEEKLL